MALSAEKRKELLSLNLPDSQRVRGEVQDYLERSGLMIKDFAHRVGYSNQAVEFFLSGKYEAIAASDLAIKKSFLDFMAAHPVGEAEALAGRLYNTENVRLLRKYFYEALEGPDAYCIEGDPGTQKSFVLERLVQELNRRELSKNGHGRRAYYIYSPQGVSRSQLMKIVAQACGSISTGDVPRIVRNLRFDFRGPRALLVFDEAQHLSVECLEAVRELHDLAPHFGLLFAGSHQLARTFVSNALTLEQWNSRFSDVPRLPGLSEDEAADIIRGELGAHAKAKVIAALVKDSKVKALASAGQHEYISARRLFKSLRKLTAAGPVSAGGEA